MIVRCKYNQYHGGFSWLWSHDCVVLYVNGLEAHYHAVRSIYSGEYTKHKALELGSIE